MLHIEETSCSQDWSRKSDYYYRPDGSLAYVHSTITTFTAVDQNSGHLDGAIIEDSFFYDSTGKVIDSQQHAWNLSRKKELDSYSLSFNPKISPDIYVNFKPPFLELLLIK